LKRADLQTLRLLTSHGRGLVPTVGGMLLFGRQPEQRFPDAWIQCGRFKDTNKTEINDSAVLPASSHRLIENV
jgi:ATP-dependent DNA helicase RecG